MNTLEARRPDTDVSDMDNSLQLSPADEIASRIAHLSMSSVPAHERIAAINLMIRSGLINLSRIHETSPNTLAELANEMYRQTGVHSEAYDD